MANPWHHAVSSSRKWGGAPDDYLAVHEWFDETKAWMPDFRHRALRHHSEGIFECMEAFGSTVVLSTCGSCGKARSEHEERVCEGHPDDGQFNGPMGETFYCDGSCEGHIFKEKMIPVRWIGEQHVQEDLGHIPTAADWLRRLQAEPWMNRSRKLSRELEREEQR